MMASSKESRTSRPLNQHRPMSSAAPMSMPARHSNSRVHAHSVSLGTFNPTHRVTRRKSMTSNGMAAVAAVVHGIDEASLEAMVSSDGLGFALRAGNGIRRAESSSTVRPGTSVSESYSTTALHGSDGGAIRDGPGAEGDSAVVDGPSLAESGSGFSKARNRRASEGAHLSKADGKRASGELRCEKCGKGYKHSSCLAKHLWEHTPEWSYTSKLLISKHQQVQLLEAASVLVNMNHGPSSESAKASDSDNSLSPVASGSSDIQDDESSSVETTPPPMSDHVDFPSGSEIRNSKRYSSNSSVFSRSYQSLPSGSMSAGSFPTTASYGSFHHPGYQRRPSTSGTSNGMGASDDEAGLAAAVELCNFGARTGPVPAGDIPPVPPLPARYVSHNASLSAGGVGYQFYRQEVGPAPSLAHRISDERDVKMQESPDGHAPYDDEYDQRFTHRGRNDEYDDGVFGHMEE